MSIQDHRITGDAPRSRFSAVLAPVRAMQLEGSAAVALVALCVMALFAIVAPPLLSDVNTMGSDSFAPPSLTHLMGTDDLGRDVFSRFAYGARTSLMVGVLAAVTACIIGRRTLKTRIWDFSIAEISSLVLWLIW